MLSRLSKDVADCYRQAAECQQLAKLATDEKDREFYLAREEDWLLLARSHQFQERIGLAIGEIDNRRGVIDTRSCPACEQVTPIHYQTIFVCNNCQMVFEAE